MYSFYVVDDCLYKCIFKDFGNKMLKVVFVEVCYLLYWKFMMLIDYFFFKLKECNYNLLWLCYFLIIYFLFILFIVLGKIFLNVSG